MGDSLLWDLAPAQVIATFHADAAVIAVCATDTLYLVGSANGAVPFLELRE